MRFSALFGITQVTKMNDELESEIRRKIAVFEEIVRSELWGTGWLNLMNQVLQGGLASHKASTLEQIAHELDTMAEEAFVRPNLRKYHDRYWGHNVVGLVEREVKSALFDRRIRDEDQMRVINIYLDQIATGTRVNFLGETQTEQLRTLVLGFLSHNV